MNKQAFGTRQSAFGHNLFSLISSRRQAGFRANKGALAECRVLSAECLFSSHIARSCTVMLRNTSVTNLGLADSVLIDVGKPWLGQGSRRGGWLAVAGQSCAIGPLEEALASNRGR
jgi:hypothetical protein